MEGPRRKSVIITGASGGMGSAATEEMARRGWRVIMACRNLGEGGRRAPQNPGSRTLRAARDSGIAPRLVRLDKGLRRQDAERGPAGRPVQQRGNAPQALLADSRRLRNRPLGVNYLGPWLLTRLMLPSLGDYAGIVNMVSISAKAAAVDRDFFEKGEKDFHQLRTYADHQARADLFLHRHGTEKRQARQVKHGGPRHSGHRNDTARPLVRPADRHILPTFLQQPGPGRTPGRQRPLLRSNMQLFSGNGRRDIPQRLLDRREDIEWLWNETAARLEKYF